MKRFVVGLLLALLAGGIVLTSTAAEDTTSVSRQGPAKEAAVGPEVLFRKANALYKEGDYAGAAELYRRVVEADPGNPVALFNLGNTAYRLGHLGRAVVAYRKALLVDPDFTDARKNLAFVRKRRTDKIEIPTPSLIAKLLARAQTNAGTGLLITNGLFALVLALLFRFSPLPGDAEPESGAVEGEESEESGEGRRSRRGRALRFAAIFLGVLFLGNLLLVVASGTRKERAEAVVVAKEVPVYAEPKETAPVLTVHDGLEVVIRRSSGSYVEIGIADAPLGWVRSAVLYVLPKRERNFDQRAAG
ncbi:MAG: tetratricopeptide repeat protein [Candidatus Hydrogenedentota bacterium]|nr:MAG: tetratricopeptide repeat protein [Candidatus Hydrogenedentota bacterium]